MNGGRGHFLGLHEFGLSQLKSLSKRRVFLSLGRFVVVVELYYFLSREDDMSGKIGRKNSTLNSSTSENACYVTCAWNVLPLAT